MKASCATVEEHVITVARLLGSGAGMVLAAASLLENIVSVYICSIYTYDICIHIYIYIYTLLPTPCAS